MPKAKPHPADRIIVAATTDPSIKKRVTAAIDAANNPFAGINIHPADELAALREEIKQMESRADELKDILKAEGADLNGNNYIAVILSKTRETLDRKAIEEAFGKDAVAPFVKSTSYQQVDLKEHK